MFKYVLKLIAAFIVSSPQRSQMESALTLTGVILLVAGATGYKNALGAVSRALHQAWKDAGVPQVFPQVFLFMHNREVWCFDPRTYECIPKEPIPKELGMNTQGTKHPSTPPNTPKIGS